MRLAGTLPLMRAYRAFPKQSGAIDSQTQQVLDQNRLTSDRATYWMAATQFEGDQIEACAGTLKTYNRDFPLGQMREAAGMRLAACFMKAQQLEAASQILEKIEPGPNQLRRHLLSRRLIELHQQIGNPTSDSPSEPVKPVEPAVPPSTPLEAGPQSEPPAKDAAEAAVPPPPPQAEPIPSP